MLYGRQDIGSEPSHAELEALLRTRRISEECDQYHADAEEAGCVNTSCMCWCH